MSKTQSFVEKIRIANNFEYLGPLSKSELFFDRVKELQDALVVCGQIVKGTTGGVLVLGGRGSGKTSFLDALRRELTSRATPNAKIPLDEGMVQAGNEKLFFRTVLTDLIKASQETGLLEKNLANKIVDMLSGFGKIDEIGIEFLGFNLIARASKGQLDTQFPYTVLRDGLNDFLKLVSKKGRGNTTRGAILLLDEGDALTLNRNLLQILRNVFQETPRVGLVIAGSTKLLSQVSDVFSPIPRFFRKIELGPYPADSIVYDAIRGPLDLATKDLAEQGINLEVVHRTFDRIVTQISGRMPMEINMLSNFAYDLGAKRIKQTNNKFKLFMKADRELFGQAIKQLGGTKEYGAFISELDKNEISCLVLLSKSLENETVDEIAVLMALHEMGDALQEASVKDVGEKIENAMAEKEKIAKLLGSISIKAQEHKINVLSSTLMGKPRFAVEDQWVRAYFKYGWSDIDVDLELGLKPRFGGIRVFGDPIATIVHSVFFPRLAPSLGDRDSFRAHVGAGDGQWLRAARGRKIISITYIRFATNSPYHIAFQVKQAATIEGIKKAIGILMASIKKASLIDNHWLSVRHARAWK